MDFLRIRQKAREQARAREEAARSPAAAPVPSPPPAPSAALSPSSPTPVPPGAPPAPVGLEDALRAELAGAPADAVALPPRDEEPDPLDEFFWRDDETAPSLPDIVAVSEVPAAAPPAPRREWLTFRLGGEEYALEIQHVREVLKPPPLTEVPRAPAHILGVIMVRGEVIAVIDPRIRLGLPPAEPGPRARVLVCDAGEASCGVLVDAVSHVIRLAAKSIEPRPAGVGHVAAEFIAGIGRERNRLVILLDAPTLLADSCGARGSGAVP